MKTTKITEFTQDPQNANKGTERGKEMLDTSISKLGAGRSIVVDKHGTIIAGNKTAQSAIANGLSDALVVETTGDKLVVVKRNDLDLATDAKAKELAIADNRVGEISLEWDQEVLLELQDEIDLSGYFTDEELILESVSEPDYSALDEADDEAIDSQSEGLRKSIMIEFTLEHYQLARDYFSQLREKDEYLGGFVIKLVGDYLAKNG